MLFYFTVSVTRFNNQPESSSGFTILIMPSISLFEFISVAFPDPKTFLFIPAFAADVAALNPKWIKTLF